MVRSASRALAVLGSLGGVAMATSVLRALGTESPTTAALIYLLIVLFVASSTTLSVATVTAVAALFSLNFFFMPPVGTFTIADPQNWVALFAFLVVAFVASQLSSTARARATEAIDRRNEVTRLFDVSRDVLLTTDTEGLAAVARHIARRFELGVVAMALPRESGSWDIVNGGVEVANLPDAELDRAWASARGALEFDAKTRSYGGHRTVDLPLGPVRLVPVRIGVRPVGLAALGTSPLEPGTADAIAGVMAIALERQRFFKERRSAEMARQRAELTSALLASLGHDLRTPLTAIRVAVTNAGDVTLPPEIRTDQAALAVSEIDHLARLLQEILDLARIEAGGVRSEPHWVTPGAILEAAAAHIGSALAHHRLAVSAEESIEVQLDPRLTAAALAHLLENAAKYSPPGTTITVDARVGPEGLQVSVCDEGPGLQEEDLAHLFEPFMRGSAGRGTAGGTGLGLAITRGLLAAEDGRVWAERGSPGGARFTIVVPAAQRPVTSAEAWA